MEKTTPRRTFLSKTFMASAVLALASSTSVVNAFSSNNSPFKGYNPFAEYKTDLRTSLVGKHVQVKGQIFDATGKHFLPNAKLEVWHLSPNSKKFEHRAILQTDSDGSYQFITDYPEREIGKMPRIYFRVSKDSNSYFTELSFNEQGAFISGKHWEENHQLGDKLLFPTHTNFLNHSTFQFNIVLNNH